MHVSEPMDVRGTADATRARIEWARRIAFMRRRWTRHFDADLFGGPAKDMLIALYLAEQEGRKLTVHDVATAGETPPTTGLRWINTLVERGVMLRVPDPQDRRRAFIHLTEQARGGLDHYLDDVIERFE